jgi:hypothetical protein
MTEGGPPSFDGTEITGNIVLGPGLAKGDSPSSLQSLEILGYDT